MSYHSRLIDDNDLYKLNILIKNCSDYYNLVYKRDPEYIDVTGIFNEIPENKSYDDKFVIGIFNENKDIIGVIDIVRDYPVLNTWYIGLMMIDPNYRNSGLGCNVFDDTEEWAVDLGAQKLRLGVAEQNKKAINFWNKMGFKLIKTVEKDLENIKTNILVLEKNLNT